MYILDYYDGAYYIFFTFRTSLPPSPLLFFTLPSFINHQGNMLQDHVRTGCYHQAFLRNAVDFKDKVVLDVGTGTGILAFFAIQAGARLVYAVEVTTTHCA